MTTIRLAWMGLASWGGVLASIACSSPTSGTDGKDPTGSGGVGVTSVSATGTSSGPGGQAGLGATAGGSGGAGVSAGGQAGTGSGGQAGTATGGSNVPPDAGDRGVVDSGASDVAAIDPADTKPWRALNVTSPPGQHVHGKAGLDPRAARMLGKLVVDLGVTSGGYVPWLGKRGFHSMGVSFPMCAVNQTGGDFDGNCRLNTFDGLPHGDQSSVSPAESISGQVLATIKSLQQSNAEEDWGYFLNQDGMTVRWSDVAFTGVSHGATTAARIGRAVRLYRAVSRSGPRDNGCGLPGGVAQGDFDPQNPPWVPNCTKVATWLDETPATPADRFYGLVGTTDVEYGDIMFAMDRMKYPGTPVKWNVAGANLAGTSRFYSTEGGHLDFLLAAQKPLNTEAVIDIAFGVPPENQNPAF